MCCSLAYWAVVIVHLHHQVGALVKRFLIAWV